MAAASAVAVPPIRVDRELPVHRGVDLADLRVPRGLRERHAGLVGLDGQVGVGRRLDADRRVHVEAVDGRLALLRGGIGRHGAVGRDAGRRPTRGARVRGEAGPAQPHGVGRAGRLRDQSERARASASRSNSAVSRFMDPPDRLAGGGIVRRAVVRGHATTLTPRARVVEWQTRRTQNPLSARTCGFESRPGHRVSQSRIPPWSQRFHRGGVREPRDRTSDRRRTGGWRSAGLERERLTAVAEGAPSPHRDEPRRRAAAMLGAGAQLPGSFAGARRSA